MNGMPSATRVLTLARISQVLVTDEMLSVDLDDGRTISVPIGWYPRLVYGTAGERANFQVSGGGYGIHWPDLDEDIGVEGLLLGKRSSESTASFTRWLQARQTARRAKAKRRPDRRAGGAAPRSARGKGSGPRATHG